MVVRPHTHTSFSLLHPCLTDCLVSSSFSFYRYSNYSSIDRHPFQRAVFCTQSVPYVCLIVFFVFFLLYIFAIAVTQKKLTHFLFLLLQVIKFCQLRAVDISMKHGISQFSPNCFAFAFYAVFDDTDELLFTTSIRFAKLAIRLAKKQQQEQEQERENKSGGGGGGGDWRQHLVVDGLVFRHWMDPHIATIDDVSSFPPNRRNVTMMDSFAGAAGAETTIGRGIFL